MLSIIHVDILKCWRYENPTVQKISHLQLTDTEFCEMLSLQHSPVLLLTIRVIHQSAELLSTKRHESNHRTR